MRVLTVLALLAGLTWVANASPQQDTQPQEASAMSLEGFAGRTVSKVEIGLAPNKNAAVSASATRQCSFTPAPYVGCPRCAA